MPLTLPQLPWPEDALEPYISRETIQYHYGKHHNAYVTKLNAAIEGTPQADETLENIIKNSEGSLFNNAAQVWNHTFYWNCMSDQGGGPPQGEVADRINKKWGSFDVFQKDFDAAAGSNFGSGWTWLVENKGELEILNTSNADTPMVHGQKALLTLDVWEHAYYIDYRNARPKYIEAFWKLINWDFVKSNFTI